MDLPQKKAQSITLKKIVRRIIIIGSCILIFIIFTIWHTITMYDDCIKITKSSELQIPINNVWINHGAIVINRKYCICEGLDASWYKYYDTLWNLPQHTLLIKESNSDSIFFTSSDKNGFYLVLK